MILVALACFGLLLIAWLMAPDDPAADRASSTIAALEPDPAAA